MLLPSLQGRQDMYCCTACTEKYPVPDYNRLCKLHTKDLTCCMHTACQYHWEEIPLHHSHSSQRDSVGGELVH